MIFVLENNSGFMGIFEQFWRFFIDK